MNKLFSIFSFVSAMLSLASCGVSYNIEGSSDISGLDSRMMYLKTRINSEYKSIDSTEVVHGQFGFSGSTDSVRIAFLVVDQGNMPLPLVLEKGDINVSINKTRSEWGGTPLNDKLYRFVKTLDSLNVQLQDLEHQYTLAFMDGEDMNEVIPRLSRANQVINMHIDTLITHSISENFDNILGPGIFMLVTQMQQMPQMSPWVVEIMSKATDNFKNDPYVKEYLEAADYIQNVQNGLVSEPGATGADTSVDDTPAPAAPTPNEMAAPAKKEAAKAAPDATAEKVPAADEKDAAEQKGADKK